jgi:undecaprenyl-diphosphatase
VRRADIEAMQPLVHLDERVFLAINGRGGPALDTFFVIVTNLGRGVSLALLVLGAMALFDRRRLRLHVVAMVLSVGIGALAVEGVKWVVDRDRPGRHFAAAGDHGGVAVRMPAAKLLRRSFPSGHAQSAFGAATYVALLYPVLAVPVLVVAALIGVSRIYLGLHFPLDVLVGALCGVAFSVVGFRLRVWWAARRAPPSS